MIGMRAIGEERVELCQYSSLAALAFHGILVESKGSIMVLGNEEVVP